MRPEILEKMRREAQDIFYEGLAAVDPETCIRRCCSIQGPVLKIESKAYDLDRFTKILVLGAGKAGAAMAFALESLLGDRITAGLVIVKYGHVRPLKHITLAEAGHPMPDENGLRAAEKLLDLAREADENALVCLVLSDVVGDNLDIIASGPAVADPGTFGLCLDIVRARGLGPKLPPAVLRRLENGARGQIPETPKKGDPAFEKVSHFLITNNSLALQAAGKKAEAMGYRTLILPDPVDGETTVTIRGKGKGGPTLTNVMDLHILLVR